MADRSERLFQRVSLQRNSTKSIVDKELKKLKTLTEADPVDRKAIELQLSKTNHFGDQLLILNAEVLDAIVETGADMQSEIEAAAEFQSEIIDVVKLAESLLNDRPPSTEAGSHTSSIREGSIMGQSPHMARAKLPKLELPNFSGDPIQWQSFWDSFESKVHDDVTITDIDKLHYLLRLLEAEAKDAVIGYRPTSSNYPVVVSVLKERFGNPETAKFKHFEALFTLPSADSNHSRLKDIYNQCEQHIRSLVALGLPEDTFGQVFVPLILSKLPQNTRLQLHRSQGQKQWDLQSLRALMKQEIIARDLSDRFSKSFGVEPPVFKNKPTEGHNTVKNQNSRHKQEKVWVTQGSLVSHLKNQQQACAFCNGPHYSDACHKHKDVDSRKSVLKDNCFKCLGSGHMVKDCKRTKPCYYCKGHGHHSSLCYKQFSSKSGQGGGKGQKDTGSAEKFSNQKGNSNTSALAIPAKLAMKSHTVLKMATVYYPKANRTARIYLDDGSSTSYMTTQLARELNLKLSKPEYFSVGRFGSTKRRSQRIQTAEIPIPLRDGSVFTMPIHVVDVITSSVQKIPLDPQRYPALAHLPLADTLSSSMDMVDIDILVGGDYLHLLLTGERVAIGDGLFLYGSQLGYITAGSIQTADKAIVEQTGVTLFISSNQIPRDVMGSRWEQFWSLEDMGIKDDPHIDDNTLALNQFNDKVKLVEGRYQVGLPWRTNADSLPNNYGLALGRLKTLHRKLEGQRETLQNYDSILQSQVESGIIEDAPTKAEGPLVHYIPHHSVVKPDSKTTKLRIVYDASAKLNKRSPSLNDSLFRGPVVVQNLCGLLLRFRTWKIVTLCDIEKAFHQVGVSPDERDALRFLWLKDPKKPITNDNLRTLRFCRVPFGMVCSPFLLDETIRHHLSTKGDEVARNIQRNIYVDNIQAGHQCVTEAVQYYSKAKAYFDEISMNIREWYSNSEQFLKAIPQDDVGQGTMTKILGLSWKTQTDQIKLAGALISADAHTTKRRFLSALSLLFDPCGWVSPIATNAKILVQDPWRAHAAWDQPVPVALEAKIKDTLQDITKASDISFQRTINAHIHSPEAIHELHCFVDASAKVFAAVVYVRSSLPNGKVSVGLAFAKARLAPLKSMTIPRLELMSNVVGVRLIQFVEKELAPKVQIYSKTIWTDSKCVLHWLNSSRRLKVFVANRVAEIKRNHEIQFRYIPTVCNPADIPTKGATVDQLNQSQLWWKGPSFLVLEANMWPESIERKDSLPDAELEYSKTEVSSVLVSTTPQGPELVINPEKFSNWKLLVRITAYVIRAVRRFKAKLNPGGINVVDQLNPLTPTEMGEAETLWIRYAQQSLNQSTEISQGNRRALNMFTDDKEVIRCKGRLQNSDVLQASKAPILLPKTHHITSLVIRAFHENLGHSGVRQTLASLRERFWIPQGRRRVQTILNRCIICKKVQGGHYKLPPFPPLPEFRVTQAAPFARTGVDYFGPLLVKSDESPSEFKKVWVALFTCCVTRAVYLDVVLNLTTDKFLMCFRRFAAHFGAPNLLISDNAKHFKAANQFFNKAIKTWADKSTFHWKFITELSPWMGGFYERMVGTIKMSLKKTLGQKRLQVDQLLTLLYEIASIVNSRPLVAANTEHQPGEIALTPAHFLGKGNRPGLPQTETEDDIPFDGPHTAERLIEKWKCGQRILTEYWRCWRNDYLATLRERNCSTHKQRNCSPTEPQIGTVVQIKGNQPRCYWSLGIVTNLHLGVDGHCRSVDIRFPGGRVLTRPLKLVFPLEIGSSQIETVAQDSSTPPPESEQSGVSPLGSLPTGPTRSLRPPRKAALLSRDRTVAELISSESDDE